MPLWVSTCSFLIALLVSTFLRSVSGFCLSGCPRTVFGQRILRLQDCPHCHLKEELHLFDMCTNEAWPVSSWSNILYSLSDYWPAQQCSVADFEKRMGYQEKNNYFLYLSNTWQQQFFLNFAHDGRVNALPMPSRHINNPRGCPTQPCETYEYVPDNAIVFPSNLYVKEDRWTCPPGRVMWAYESSYQICNPGQTCLYPTGTDTIVKCAEFSPEKNFYGIYGYVGFKEIRFGVGHFMIQSMFGDAYVPDHGKDIVKLREFNNLKGKLFTEYNGGCPLNSYLMVVGKIADGSTIVRTDVPVCICPYQWGINDSPIYSTGNTATSTYSSVCLPCAKPEYNKEYTIQKCYECVDCSGSLNHRTRECTRADPGRCDSCLTDCSNTQFVTSCNDFEPTTCGDCLQKNAPSDDQDYFLERCDAFGAETWKTCLEQAKTCGTDSVQVLCGYSGPLSKLQREGYLNYYSGDKRWAIGTIMFPGVCVPCSVLGQACPAMDANNIPNVLKECGQVDRKGEVKNLVDVSIVNEILFDMSPTLSVSGSAIGDCSSCNSLHDPIHCDNADIFTPTGEDFYREGCGLTRLTYGVCRNCAVCPDEGQTNFGCGNGGIYAGKCTDCYSTDLINENVWKQNVEFVSESSIPCAYRCTSDYTGENCHVDRHKNCPFRTYLDNFVQPERSKCVSCVNYIPNSAVVTGQDDMTITHNRLILDGGFETVRLSEFNPFDYVLGINELAFQPDPLGTWESSSDVLVLRKRSEIACAAGSPVEIRDWPCLPAEAADPERSKFAYWFVPPESATLSKRFREAYVTSQLLVSFYYSATDKGGNVTISTLITKGGSNVTDTFILHVGSSSDEWVLATGVLTVQSWKGLFRCDPCTIELRAVDLNGLASYVAIDDLELSLIVSQRLDFEAFAYNSGTYYV